MGNLERESRSLEVVQALNDLIRHEEQRPGHAEAVEFSAQDIDLKEAEPYFSSQVSEMIDILRSLGVREEKIVQALIDSSFKEFKPIGFFSDSSREFRNEIAFKMMPIFIDVPRRLKSQILGLPEDEVAVLKKRFQTLSFDVLKVSCYVVSLVVNESVFLKKCAALISPSEA